jgi:hypothetical protein
MFDFDDTRRRSRLSTLLQQKLPLWLTLVIVLLVTVFFGVQHASYNAAEQRYKALTGELQAQQTSLQAHDADSRRRTVEESDMLFGTALGWAVRSAMLRKNLDEIDQYVSALARNPRIQLVLVADRSGKILLSTDRRSQGTRLSTHLPTALLKVDEVTVESADAQRRHLVVPLQGLTTRLGTVVVRYAAP